MTAGERKGRRRRWPRRIAILLGGSVGLLIVLLLAGYWRLTRGPVSLAWIEPQMEAELSALVTPLSVSSDGVRIEYRKRDRLLIVAADGLSIGRDGDPALASATNIVVAFSFDALWEGIRFPAQVEIGRLEGTVVRSKDGRFQLGLPERKTPKPASAFGLNDLLDALGDVESPLAQLTLARVQAVALEVDDRKLGISWGCRQGSLECAREGDLWTVQTDLKAWSDQKEAELWIRATGNPQNRELHGSVEVEGLEPSALVPWHPRLGPLAVFSAPADGRLEVAITDNGKAALVSLGLDTEVGRVQTEANLRLDSLQVAGETHLEEVKLWTLAPAIPALEPLGGIRLALGGRVKFTLGQAEPWSAEVDLTTSAGRATVPKLYPDGLEIETIALQGEINREFELVRVKRLRVDFGDETLTVTASGGRDGQGLTGRIEAEFDSVSLERLPEIWPAALAPKPRAWIEEHIKNGRVSALAARVELASASDGTPNIHLNKLEGSFRYEDLELDLLSPQPPVVGVDGTGTFTAKGFEFMVEAGSQRDIVLQRGRVTISDLDRPCPQLHVNLAWEAPVAEALEIITGAPLSITPHEVMKPADFSGTASGNLALGLPLSGPAIISDLAVQAKTKGLAWKAAPLGLHLTEGDLTVDLKEDLLRFEGVVQANGVPVNLIEEEFLGKGKYARRIQVTTRLDDDARQALGLEGLPLLAGVADLELEVLTHGGGATEVEADLDLTECTLDLAPLGWRKVPGRPGSAHVAAWGEEGQWSIELSELSAEDLRVQASAAFGLDPFALTRVELDSLAYGSNSVKGSLARDNRGGYTIQVQGSSFDAQPIVRFFAGKRPSEAWKRSEGPRAPTPPLAVTADFGHLQIGKTLGLTGFAGRADFDGERWQTLSLEGAPLPGEQLSVRYAPEGQAQTLRVNADEAVFLLATALGDANFRGGHLDVAGNQNSSEQPLVGSFEVREVSIVEASLLARLLKLASLNSTLDALSEEGLFLSLVEGKFSLQDRRLETRDIRIYGDLGVTGAGVLDFGESTIDMEGTLAPMHRFQRLIGKIPLIGKILTGVRNEGIVAASFTIKGPLNDPKVEAQPLSALTPGIARDLFRRDPSRKQRKR